jgi:amidophosphoribosyltransferase
MNTECGIFSVMGSRVPKLFTEMGMRNIQHRGQDSYGLVSFCPSTRQVSEIKDFGLLPAEFPSRSESMVNGLELIIGHTRYSTVCATLDKESIQPISLSDNESFSDGYSAVYIAFNGNIPNFLDNMRKHLDIQDVEGNSDTYLFKAIWQKLANKDNARETGLEGLAIEFVRYCINNIPGAYSCVLLVGDKLIGFRDRYGYKPLWCYTSDPESYNDLHGFISETCQLGCGNDSVAILDYKLTEVPAGGYMVLSYGKNPVTNVIIESPRHELSKCSMESIYFMQDISLIQYDNGDQVQVRNTKYMLGMRLALEEAHKEFYKEYLYCGVGEWEVPEESSVVIHVPESSYPLAQAYASKMGYNFIPDTIKKIYNIRSFIESTNEARVGKIKRKFQFDFALIERMTDVIIIDDSLVRGNTMRYIIEQLKTALPNIRIHIRIASPIIKDKCWFGIDISERNELIWWQSGANLETLRANLGVASIRYLSVDGIRKVLGKGHCTFCFGEVSDANRKTLEW